MIPKHVQMIPVVSTNLDAIGHDLKTLYVRFKNKAEYAYSNFTKAKWMDFLKENQKDMAGTFFQNEIRKKPLTHQAKKLR